jgi:hypothetical protein
MPYPRRVELLRRHVVSFVLLALAGIIGVTAIADHRIKNARMSRAEVAEWYCRHDGTRCGGPSSARIEARWNRRQLGYEVAVIALGGFAVVRFIVQLARHTG